MLIITNIFIHLQLAKDFLLYSAARAQLLIGKLARDLLSLSTPVLSKDPMYIKLNYSRWVLILNLKFFSF